MIGEIRLFAGTFAPRSWAICAGQLVAISSNSALFSILGTTFGGDGRTTFGLPDFRGRSAMHAGRGPGLTDRRLGERGGVETVYLNVTQIPSHTHTLGPCEMYAAVNSTGNLPAAGNTYPQWDSPTRFTKNGTLSKPMAPGSVSAPAIGNTGSNLGHQNMQPWLCMYYIIATIGTYPSRN